MTHQGCGHRGIHLMYKLCYLCGCTGKDRTTTDKDHRLFRFSDQFERRIHGLCCNMIHVRKNLLRFYRIIFAHIGRNILGNIHENRTRTAALCNLKGLAQRICQLCNIFDDRTVLGDRDRHTGDIDLLEGILTQKRHTNVGSDRYNRDGIHIGCGDTGNQIGSTGAGSSHTDANLSCGTGITVRCMGSTLLMGSQHVADFAAVLI